MGAAGKASSRGMFAYDFLYLWMSPTMFLGKSRPLQLSDLPPLPPGDSAEEMLRSRLPGGLWGLVKCETWPLLASAVTMFLYSASQVIGPLALLMVLLCMEQGKQLIGSAEPPSRWVSEDLMPAWLALFLSVQLVAAVTNHWQLHIAYHIGQRLRAQLICLVFEKAVAVDPAKRLPSGRVLNLMSTDAQKFLEALPFVHKVWSVPLQITLSGTLLVKLAGTSAFFGIAVLALLVPMSKRLSRVMQRFRAQRMALADERLRLCVELLSNVRCVKYFTWERPFLVRVLRRRKEELRLALFESLIWVTSMITTVLGPITAFGLIVLGRMWLGGASGITASVGFGTLALVNALRFPIMDLGAMIATLIGLRAGWCRLEDFLSLDDAKLTRSSSGRADAELLRLADCSFGYAPDAGERKVILTGVNTTVRAGELVVVFGRVGCGKSTLLQGIVGEAAVLEGKMRVAGPAVAYCPQQAWVLNASLRDNILFGQPYDEDWYGQVVQACCLGTDLQQLPHGDQTEIGERGVTLSGGQKQRVALARAAYQRQCNLLVLDDVFSALDAHTGRRVLLALLGKPNGLLRTRAVVLAAHGQACLELADHVLLLESSADGGPCRAVAAPELAAGKLSTSLKVSADVLACDQVTIDVGDASPGSRVKPAPSRLMREEDREIGGISWRCIRSYISCMRSPCAVCVFVSSGILERVFIVGLDWWIARWSREDPDDASLVPLYLSGYWSIFAVAACFVSLSRMIIAFMTNWAAGALFERMALRVIRGPVSWWDTTPLGRVLNRFSFDTENVDSTLVTKLFPATISLSWMMGAVVVMAGVTWPYSLFFIPVPIIVYIWLFQFSRRSIRELQRLDGLARSPIQTVFTEILHGLSSVRAYACGERYVGLLRQHVDVNAAAVFAFNSSSRWLGVRLEVLATAVTCATGIGCWLLRDRVSPGMVGMCLVWSQNLTISLNFNCLYWSQTEAAFTSVERMAQYAEDVPSEGAHKDLDDWRASGLPLDHTTTSACQPDFKDEGACLLFEEVSMRYRDGLPLSLKEVSFQLQPSERAAVVGRTGAGKSSLAAALFRMVPLASGRIVLCGVNLLDVPLDVARRSLCIITQDPVIFSGTVRYNLDPLDEHTDEECSDALARAQLARTLSLEATVDDGGANCSTGERQLLCLARTLVLQPRLLLCDEATASVDRQTDAQVQECLRYTLQDSSATLLTIAHRLSTIADHDKVLVMEAGNVVEMGSPRELLLRKGGAFRHLVDQAGVKEAKAVREIAGVGSGWTPECLDCAAGVASWRGR